MKLHMKKTQMNIETGSDCHELQIHTVNVHAIKVLVFATDIHRLFSDISSFRYSSLVSKIVFVPMLISSQAGGFSPVRVGDCLDLCSGL